MNLTKNFQQLRNKANDLLGNFPHLVFDYVDPEPNFDSNRVYGVVAKLFEIKDHKYASALEVAAGNKLFNIIVDTEQTGKLLLNRGQLRRRVTMLPLTQIRGNVISEAVVKRAESLVGIGNVFTALSLVSYDPVLQPAMEYVFGNVLICPDMDTAKKVAFYPGIEKRTVTLEGDIFDPQGTLSGGSRSSVSDSLLARLHEWHAVDQMAKKAREEVCRAEACLKTAASRAQKISQLREALDKARHELDILETQMRQTDKHRLRADLLLTKNELVEVTEKLEIAEDRLSKASLKAERAHAKASNAESERKKEQQDAVNTVAQAKALVEASTANLREKTALKETFRLEAEELAKELDTLKVSLEESKEHLKNCKAEEERCKSAAQTALQALNEAQNAVKKQQNLVDETQRELMKTEKEAGRINQSLTEVNMKVEKLKHQIELQKKESEEDGQRILRFLEEHPWIESERDQFGVKNGTYCFTTRDPNETLKRLKVSKERRDRISRKVNMRAMNMLGSAEEQYAELVKRQDIVLADKRKIQAVIDDLDKRKKEVLVSAYNKVNEEFCNIFSTLLPGSKARLFPPENMTVLEGLEIKVAFGDVWKESLSELSGGQRSLAALSLILALLLFKPAPLYILDEVDAALDLSHTQNIGLLIKNHFKHSQFVIVSLKDGMFNNANVLFKTKFVNGISTVTRHVPFRIQDEEQQQNQKHKRIR